MFWQEKSITGREIRSRRIRSLVCAAVVTVLGFVCKYYRGPAAGWINDSLAGVFYEIFWCLLIFFIVPRSTPWKIAAWVFGATCLLEGLQLWHPPLLQALRSTFVGAVLLGTTFSRTDFLYYGIGCAAGWGLIAGPCRGKQHP